METHAALIRKIFLATRKIQSEFPELVKYMDEIPNHVMSHSDPKVPQKALDDYLESLIDITWKYAKEHTGRKTKFKTKTRATKNTN